MRIALRPPNHLFIGVDVSPSRECILGPQDSELSRLPDSPRRHAPASVGTPLLSQPRTSKPVRLIGVTSSSFSMVGHSWQAGRDAQGPRQRVLGRAALPRSRGFGVYRSRADIGIPTWLQCPWHVVHLGVCEFLEDVAPTFDQSHHLAPRFSILEPSAFEPNTLLAGVWENRWVGA